MADLDDFIAFLEEDDDLQKELDEPFDDIVPIVEEEPSKKQDESDTDELFGPISDDEDEEGSVRFKEVKGWTDKNIKHKPEQQPTDDSKSGFSFGNIKSSLKPFKSGVVVDLNSSQEQEAIEFLGIRVIKPTSSAHDINRHLVGKRILKLLEIPRHVDRMKREIEGDWITGGVVVDRKSQTAKSSGKPYTILKLSDMRNLERHVSLFLFAESHGSHWKVDPGSVIGLLNPVLMSQGGQNSSSGGKYAKKKSNDEVCALKLDHPLKLLVLGRNKDYGRCKTIKKNGDICSALINTSVSPVCVFHVNLDYKKMVSSRPELKATYSGIAPKSALDAQDVNQDIVDKNFALLGPGGARMTVVKKIVSENNKTGISGVPSASTQISQETQNDKNSTTGNKKPLKKKNFIELAEEEIARKNALLKQLDFRKELEAQMIQEAVKNPLTLAARNLAKVTECSAKKDSKDLKNSNPCQELKEILDGKRRQVSVGQTSSLRVSSLTGNEVKVNLSKFSSANDIFSQMKPVKQEVISAPKPQLGRGLTPGTKSVALDVKKAVIPASNRLQIRIPSRAKIASNSREANDIRSSMVKAHAAVVLKRSASQMLSQSNDDPKVKAEEAKRKKIEAIKRKVELALQAEDESIKSGQQSKQVKDALEAALKRKSSHQKELKEIEIDQEDRYFQYMEKREMLENKIASTMTVTVDVVECKKCAYVEVDQSDHCKNLGHVVLRRKADKKFFKCNNCNKKIYIFDQILPVRPCRSCHSTSWSKTSMANVRSGPKNPAEQLVIRGDEIKFLNSAN